MREYVITVVGVTFENRQPTIAALTGTEPIRIEPEPENPYDANALAVKVAVGGDIKHVGYIPRHLAAKFAPRMDGEPITGRIHLLTGGGHKAYGLQITVDLPEEGDLAV